jgi:microcystin-dependent protein
MGSPYIGQISMTGFSFAPYGWAFCNGQLMSIAQYEALYALIGTTYGGDGVQTFALPDLRCRLPIHQGTGQGLSTYVIGQAAGTEQVTLTTGQLPSHIHSFYATSASATSARPNNNLAAVPYQGILPSLYTIPTSGQAPNVKTLNPQAIGQSGSNLPHPNMMPSLGVSFIIALTGVYPSQN